MFVPVVDINQKPLMPTTPARARRWIKSGKATPFWKRGVFCVRLNQKPSDRKMQIIAVGIDPGSKKEGFTVKSFAHTYLNIQADAVNWVKDAVHIRAIMRRNRRLRKTPYRQPRSNRLRNTQRIAPSVKARWQWKLRICSWLVQLFPITTFVVEDIKAPSLGKPHWDSCFSPLMLGKYWFYSELRILGRVETKFGWETKQFRDNLGLKKHKNKTAELFSAHCVDSWVLANSLVGGHTQPDNERLLCITSFRFRRRRLHFLQPAKGGIRKRDGGTRSLSFKRGSLVKHPKYGLTYVGGNQNSRISLHCLVSGKRLTHKAKPSDCQFLSFSSWRSRLLPIPVIRFKSG